MEVVLANGDVLRTGMGAMSGARTWQVHGPLTGRDVTALCGLMRSLADRHGVAYSPGRIASPGSLVHVLPMIFDTTDEAETRRAYELYEVLVTEVAKAGYGLYRAHLRFMDLVAGQYDFNDHAQRRLNQALKDALDPNGILSPGKQGIWGKSSR
jgi:4-cresol dehydrogenase (hydroxylating) flavoprotein subunit